MQGLIGIYLRYRLRVKYGQYVKAVREEQVSDVNSHIVRYQELVREIYTFMGTKQPEQLTRSDLAKLKQWHSELKSIESSLTRYAQAIDPGFKALNTLAQYVQVIPPLMTSAAFVAGVTVSSPVVVSAVVVGAPALAALVWYYGAVAERQVVINESGTGGNNGGGNNSGPNYGQILVAIGVAGIAMSRNTFELMQGYHAPTETIEEPLGEDLAEYAVGTELASDTSQKNTFKIQLSYFKNLVREEGAEEECEDPKSALTESKKRQLQGWENHDAVHHIFHQIDVGDLAGSRSIDAGQGNQMQELFEECYRDDTDWQDPDENPGNNCGGESAANGVLLQSQFHSVVHTDIARENLRDFSRHINSGNQIPSQCRGLIDDGPDANKCRKLHQLLENVLKPYLRVLNGQAKTLSASNALNFIKTNPQLAVSVLKDPNTAIAASATLAQILLPLYQWKGAPNVEVKMPNNPKTYRWTGQNFGNVSRLYQTAPVSSIRTQNTAQIKANFKPIYATQKDLSLGDLCQEAKSIMSQYGS